MFLCVAAENSLQTEFSIIILLLQTYPNNYAERTVEYFIKQTYFTHAEEII